MTTLVTGGTGVLGRAVAALLPDARVASRRTGTNLATGVGVPAALDGVSTVIHLATTLRGPRDVRLADTLVRAAARVEHLVFVSIVGIDDLPLSYCRGKLAAERVVAGVPHTIIRATQFHDLVRTILGVAARSPLMPVPAFRVQPVDVRDLAARVVELAAGAPRGRVPDFGGPEVRTFDELAAVYLKATGRRRRRVPVTLPGKVFRGCRGGANLPPPDNPRGTVTFERYCAELGRQRRFPP